MRLCLSGLYSCVPGGKLGIFKGQTISASISAEVRASSTLRPTGWVGAESCHLFHLVWKDTDLLWLGQIHVGHDVLGCQCRHKSSDSNAWTASTAFTSKEFHWPLCTCWRLGWCKMHQVPVSVQHCGCCPVVVDWHLMLCHTQYICNLALSYLWVITDICSYISQIAKTMGSTLIRYRSDTFASDRYLIDIDPTIFAIWDHCTISN